MSAAHTTVDSPLGPVALVADDDAVAGVRLHAQQHRPADAALGPRDDAVLPDLREQLAGYLDGAQPALLG